MANRRFFDKGFKKRIDLPDIQEVSERQIKRLAMAVLSHSANCVLRQGCDGDSPKDHNFSSENNIHWALSDGPEFWCECAGLDIEKYRDGVLEASKRTRKANLKIIANVKKKGTARNARLANGYKGLNTKGFDIGTIKDAIEEIESRCGL